MSTRIEQEFYESVPHQLGSIADSLKKIADSKAPKPEVSVDVPTKDAHPIDSAFDVLAVTDVQVFPFKDNTLTSLKGFANVVLNDQLLLRGLRINDSSNGVWVGFPTDPFYKGEEFRTLVVPMTKQLREHIENCVLEKYQQVMEE